VKLLLIAAEPREFEGITESVEWSCPGVQWSRSARIGDHEALLVTNGAGAKRAAAATEIAARTFRPEAVVSTGFCGALDPSMRIGEIVAATLVHSDNSVKFASAPSSPLSFHSGPIATVDHVAGTSAEKGRLRASGAIAVEMEAAGVAHSAGALYLPFFCIRAVTDLALEDMANDFNAALRNDGHFDTMKILTGALRHPVTRVPELLRLKDRAKQSARSLGVFLVDCRF
jgi:adenosylhomocysteine nucleosidase